MLQVEATGGEGEGEGEEEGEGEGEGEGEEGEGEGEEEEIAVEYTCNIHISQSFFCPTTFIPSFKEPEHEYKCLIPYHHRNCVV
jgi:hypothetical protein